jgi:Fur family ferric uptake transcriptional regulator
MQTIGNMHKPGADVKRKLVNLLSRRGFRLTRPRRAVLDALLSVSAPLSIGELHALVRAHRIDLSSVYRTVHLLSSLGALRVADTSPGFQRVELAEQFTGHHHHLICEGCGRIGELEGCLLEEKLLKGLTRRIRRTKSFRVTTHDLRFIGVCQGCDAA